jgi:hypothetical protein
MAVVHDSTSATIGFSTVTSLSWTHTAAGSNRIAVIRLHTRADISNASATYGGAAATPIANAAYSGNNRRETWMWYLLAPPIGSSTVVISWTTDSNNVVGACTVYSGVDQITPIGTPATNNGLTSAPTVNVSSGSGQLVVDAVTVNGNPSAITADASQSERYNIHNYVFAGGSEETGATSVTMSWATTGGADEWSIVAVPLLPFAGRARIVKYLHNTFMSRAAGKTLVLDILGRDVPVEQIEFDNWIRTDGPFLPSTRRYSSTVEDPAIAYVEGLRIRGERATIETVKEAMFVSILNRLSRSA